MALMDCPDCKKPMSDQARACAQCGCPNPIIAKQVKIMGIVLLVLAAGMLAAIFIFLPR